MILVVSAYGVSRYLTMVEYNDTRYQVKSKVLEPEERLDRSGVDLGLDSAFAFTVLKDGQSVSQRVKDSISVDAKLTSDKGPNFTPIGVKECDSDELSKKYEGLEAT